MRASAFKKSLVGAAIVGSAVLGVGVTGASAAGRVEQGVDHSASVCAFSGLNDTPNDPAPEGGRVQSYGQLVRQGLKAEFPSPGLACNPTTPPPPEEL
jgi:hypothetical protein